MLPPGEFNDIILVPFSVYGESFTTINITVFPLWLQTNILTVTNIVIENNTSPAVSGSGINPEIWIGIPDHFGLRL